MCLQVFTQPWYAFVENTTYKYVPKNFFTHKEFVIRVPGIGSLRLTLFRLIWRSLYVCFTTGTLFSPPPHPSSFPHPHPHVHSVQHRPCLKTGGIPHGNALYSMHCLERHTLSEMLRLFQLCACTLDHAQPGTDSVAYDRTLQSGRHSRICFMHRPLCHPVDLVGPALLF